MLRRCNRCLKNKEVQDFSQEHWICDSCVGAFQDTGNYTTNISVPAETVVIQTIGPVTEDTSSDSQEKEDEKLQVADDDKEGTKDAEEAGDAEKAEQETGDAAEANEEGDDKNSDLPELPTMEPGEKGSHFRARVRPLLRQEHFALYKDILAECKASKKPWVDPNPPDTTYGGDTAHGISASKTPVWKVIPKIARAMDYEFLLSDPDNSQLKRKMSSDDMQQGDVGSCWFLAAVALLSQNMSMMMAFVCTRQNEEYGIYEFTFRPLGKVIKVCVDGRMPVLEESLGMYRMPFAHSKTPGELWPTLIEKAYAKLFGSYHAIEGGLNHDAIGDMLGLDGDAIEFENSKAMQRQILDLVSSACHLGCGWNTEDDGLVTGHAYSIQRMKFLEDVNGERKLFLRIHNPWGCHEWTGPYSDEWPGWDDKANERLKFELKIKEVDDGAFWMEWHDFSTRCSFLTMNYPWNIDAEGESNQEGQDEATKEEEAKGEEGGEEGVDLETLDPSERRKIIRKQLKQSQFQRFKDILEKCKNGDKRWVDPNPPPTKFVGDSAVYIEVTGEPHWMDCPRVENTTRFEFVISDQPEIKLKMSPDDMEQGDVDTSWFLSAVALLARNMAMMMAFVCTRQNDEYGIYEFTFRPLGKEIRVCVDDRIPVLEDEKGHLRTPMASSKTRGELWPMLIEKAYAKLFGGYANIEQGWHSEAINDMLGLQDGRAKLEPRELKAKLLAMASMSFHMGCTFAPDDTDDMGLVADHAYSIQKLKFAKLPNGKKKLFLRIHNPWGTAGWTGPYSDEWSGWDDDAYERLMFELKFEEGDDGSFWMVFEDFCKYYNELEWNTLTHVGDEDDEEDDDEEGNEGENEDQEGEE